MLDLSLEKLKKRIVGPSLSLITPFRKDFTLDENGLRDNIRYLFDAGFGEGNGVLLGAAVCGESPSMTISERKKVMEVIADEALGKIPIETTAHDNSQDAVIEMMRHAKDLGFDAIQLQPPWYHGTSPDEVFRFYEGVTDVVDIPVIVYNTTWLGILDGRGVDATLMARLSELDNIIGFKWSSPSWYTYINAIRDWKHRFIFTDNNYNGLGCFWGCTSFIDDIGQFHPYYSLELWNLLKSRDFDGAVEYLWKFVLPYYQWMVKMDRQGIHGEGPHVKLAMRLIGRPSGPAKPPYDVQFNSEQTQELRRIMTEGRVPGIGNREFGD